MRKKKFTLVEILSVVAIIAILCGIVFGVSGAIRSRNYEIKTRTMLKQIEVALNECKLKFGYYPVLNSYGDFEESLITGNSKYADEFKKSCNFASFEIKDGKICDAWGEPLQYKSNGRTFTLYSKGQDAESVVNAGEIKEDDAKNDDNIYLD